GAGCRGGSNVETLAQPARIDGSLRPGRALRRSPKRRLAAAFHGGPFDGSRIRRNVSLLRPHMGTMEKDLQLVGFRIGRETFGLPIALVREIVRVPEITSVPNAPDYIEGVINLRGRIIPVVDLRKRFGEKVIEASKRNRIVVVELDNRAIGLIVNSASEVIKIPPS